MGIISLVDTISIMKVGGQGLLDMAISSGRRYREALQNIKPNLSSSEKVTQEIVKSFEAMNKKVTIINSNYPIKKFLSEYDKNRRPNDESEKAYFDIDMRKLKNEYDIDEVVVIKNSYGLAIGYYGFIETSKEGFSNVTVSVVSLKDNSILFREGSIKYAKLKGKWDMPPNYDNMKNSIQKAIDENSVKITAEILKKAKKSIK